MGTVEVVVGVSRRRRWSAAEKRSMVQEAEQPGMSISAVARKYGIHANQLFRWRKLAEEGALSAVGADERVVPASEVRELKKQIRALEQGSQELHGQGRWHLGGYDPELDGGIH